MKDLQQRQANTRIERSNLSSSLLILALNYCMQLSTHLLSSDGYADGYQLNISLTSWTKVNLSDFELPSDMMVKLSEDGLLTTAIFNSNLYIYVN